MPKNSKNMSDYKQQLRERVEALGQPKRQEILDLLKSGLSIGEICEKLGLETIIVSTVVVDNIQTAHYLGSEAK